MDITAVTHAVHFLQGKRKWLPHKVLHCTRMKPIEGIARHIFLGFFLSHIPVTFLLDGQASPFNIPYPTFLSNFLAWYAYTFQDPNFLGGHYELWFRCFITAEFAVQLPYFFVASYMLLSTSRMKKVFPEWFRLASLIYASQAITAVIPILMVVLFNQNATPSQRGILSSIYMPYLLVPLALVYYVFEPDKSKAAPIPIMTGATKMAMLIFFVSHVPITVLIDSQALGNTYHPPAAVALCKWYFTTIQDPLMRPPCPLWFRTMVSCECCIQLPFFIIAIRQLRSSKYNWWFPSLSLLYGAHVLTTMLPILAELWTSTEIETIALKCILTCIYAPYAIFPAWIAHWGMTVSFQLKSKNP